ncbi:MAG: T9SS type A sorting domain-containing protein [Bacteroidales bacterium]|jgi:hypothetical protein|nr:T9SS type A sorting domain-containing protein [Bacteroidales bacterium]MDY0370434.1 T9SS type A sorting domain-containing protein [Bacteroidales bacterium]
MLLFRNVIGQHSFDFLYTTDADNVVIDGAVDHEGNAVLVGRIGEASSTGTLDAFIMKVHPDGSYITKQYELTDYNSAFNRVVILDNSNYMVLGAKGDSNNVYYYNYFWIVILNQELEILSKKSYAINSYYTGLGAFMNAIIDNEGNIAVVCSVLEKVGPDHYFPDYAMYKLTQEGDTLLSRYYQYPFDQTPYELMRMPESNNLLLLGSRITHSAIPSIVILNSEMEVIQSNSFSTNPLPPDPSSATKWLNETDFLLAGTRQFQNKRYNNNYIAVFRANTSAELFEELVLSATDTSIYGAWRKNITEANDSTIYVAGFQPNLNPNLPNTVFLFLIDSKMNLLGRKSFFIGDVSYHVWGILPMQDDGCLMMLSRHENGYLKRDIYIRKYLREDFEILTHLTELPAAALNSKAWPNPADDVLHISLENLPQDSEFRLQIYNTAGQKYFDKAFTASANSVQCHIGVLPAGNYVYQLQTASGKAGSGTFIKQ